MFSNRFDKFACKYVKRGLRRFEGMKFVDNNVIVNFCLFNADKETSV